MSRPFNCDHYCRYCIIEGCEERTDLPMQTMSISIPPRKATSFVSEDGNIISVAGVDGVVKVTIMKGGEE